MKNNKSLEQESLVKPVLLAFLPLVLLLSSSNAVFAKSREILEEPSQQLSRDFPQQFLVQLTADLIGAIKTAEQRVAQLPEKTRMKIPVGGRGPIPAGTLPRDNSSPQVAQSRYYFVAVRNPSSGRAEAITAGSLRGMFATATRNNGTLNNLNRNRAMQEWKTLVADASGSFLQSQTITVFDMYVEDTETGNIELWPDMVANAVFRDAINAVLTDSWKEW